MELTFKTNGFGDLFIPQTETGYLSGGILARYYSLGTTGVGIVLDMSTYASILLAMPVLDATTVTELLTPVTLETYEGDEYQAKINNFASKVIFLWGDIKKGGMFGYHVSSNLIAFGIWQGIAQYSDTDPNYPSMVKPLFYYQNSQGFTLNESKQLCFTFNDGSTMDVPMFTICYIEDEVSAIVYTINTNSVFQATYDVAHHNERSTSDMMINYLWTDDFSFAWKVPPFEFEAMPVRPWDVETSGNYTIYGQQIPRGGVIISGSWTGDAISADGDRGGSSEAGGGDGAFPNVNTPDNYSNPEGMEIDAINSGLVTLYNPTQQGVRNFNNFLFGGSITDTIANQLKRLVSNPYDYIIFLAMCHFTPERKADPETIKFVGIDSLVGSNVVSKQYCKIGEYVLNVSGQANNYLDFNPYCKAHLYLPYIGFVDINVDDIMGSKWGYNVVNTRLGLVYHVDLLTGSCVAQLKITRNRRVPSGNADNSVDNILYNWNGNVYEMCPLSSTDFRSVFGAVIGLAGGVAQTVGGNPVGGMLSMASAVASAKINVNKNVPNSGNYGYFNTQEPKLIIERPIQSKPYYDSGYNYDTMIGTPSNIIDYVKNFDGYLETDEDTVWGNNISYQYGDTTINAFDVEMDEIKQLFNKGVYVNV